MGYKEIKLAYEAYLKNNLIFIRIFFIFLLVNCLIFLGFYGLYQGSADSARYFFSTLAQSQAAIVAIVITLTLVAVQLAAQTYTPRVMDLFLNSKMFWVLLSVYGISIIYDIAVLAIIPPILSDKPLTELVIVFGTRFTFNAFILAGLILIIGTFLFLFLFIQNVIKQLKPENIIEGIIKATNINEIKAIAEGQIVDDPLLPIKEIGKKALISSDDSTVIKVITELNKVAEKVIAGRNFVKRKSKEEILSQSSILSGLVDKEEKNKEDNHVVSYFVSFLSDLTDRSLECKSIVVFNNIAICISNIGISLSNKKATVVINVLGTLKEMEKSLLEKGLEKDTWVSIDCFKTVSIEAAKNEQWDAVGYSIGVLGLFVSDYTEKEVKFSDEDIIYGSDIVGLWRPFFIVKSIEEIGRAIVNQIPNINGSDSLEGTEDYFEGLIEIGEAAKHLNAMAEISIKKGWDSTMRDTVYAITGIYGSLIHKGGENLSHPINPTTLMAKSLEKIATSSTNSEVYYETKKIINILEKYAEFLANKSSRNVSNVVDSLIAIYKFIYLNHCEGVPCGMMLGAPNSLGEIGRLTMANDNEWLTDINLNKLKADGYVSPESFRPTTQKIADAIEEIGINASKNFWGKIAEFSARNIIFFGTIYFKKGNEEIGKKLIVKLKNMNKAYKNKFGNLITEIMLENYKGKTFGLHKYYTSDKGFLKSQEIKMDSEDFKAFLLFKELYEKR